MFSRACGLFALLMTYRLRLRLAVPGKVGDDVDQDAPGCAQYECRQLQHQRWEPPHPCMQPQDITDSSSHYTAAGRSVEAWSS